MQFQQALRAFLFAAATLCSVMGVAAVGEEAASGSPSRGGVQQIWAAISEAKELWEWIGSLAGPAAPNDDIEGLERSTHEFSPRGIVEAPALPGDEVFSGDPAKRDEVRRGWERFVQDDAAEIARLRQRRDEQVAKAAELEQRIPHLEKSLEKLAKLKDDPDPRMGLVRGLLRQAYEVASKRLPIRKQILTNRQRIVREYDGLLARREATHKGHVQVLHVLEAIQRVPGHERSKQSGSSAALPATGTEQGSPMAFPSVVDRRISDRVFDRASPAQSQAYRTRQDASRLKKEGDAFARRTTPPTAGYSGAGILEPGTTPAFQGEIRLIPSPSH